MNCHQIIKKKMQNFLFFSLKVDDKINLCLYKINFIVVLSEICCLKGVLILNRTNGRQGKRICANSQRT